MTKTRVAGPEQPTFVERLVASIRVPYALGCVILGALIGGLGQFLANYLDTQNLSEALKRTVANSGFNVTASPSVPLIAGVIGSLLYFAVLAYTLFAVRFLRRKLVTAEEELSPFSPDGEETYHKAFGGISNWKGPVALTVVLSATYLPQQLSVYSGYSYLAYTLFSVPLQSFSFATLLWVYGSSLWGLRKFARGSLNLKPYQEDHMLGLRPMGSISVYQALAFFGVFGISAIALLLNPPDPITTSFLIVMVVLGSVLFFLPLNSAHVKMRIEKNRQQASLRNRLEALRASSSDGPPDDSKTLIQIRELLSLQMVKDEVSKIPTWPFDTGIVGRFAAIILSVTAIIIAKGIQIVLHI